MIDFLSKTRKDLIENFQISMKAIRLLMGCSVAELAEYVGVTRQTINNLETGKSRMSVMQFLSLAAVVDNYIAMNDDKYQSIATILDSNSKKSVDTYGTSFSGFSLLRRWFQLFERAGNDLVFDNGVSLDDFQMRQLAQEYKIFLDATALLAEDAEPFFRGYTDCLAAENASFIVPLRSVEYIQEQVQDTLRGQEAVRALRLLNWMQRKNVVQIHGEDGDANQYDTIISVFLKVRGKYRLCLLTQDESFAAEVLRLNETSDRGGFTIVVGHIGDDGRLAIYMADGTLAALDESAIPASLEEGVSEDAPDALLEIDESNLTSWEYL